MVVSRFAALGLLACSSTAFAAEVVPPAEATTLSDSGSSDVDSGMSPAYRKALIRRDIGIAITATGATILAGGAVLVTDATLFRGGNCGQPGVPSDCGWGQALETAGGVALGVLSVPFLAVGIPFWVGGARHMHAPAVSIAVGPLKGGAHVAFGGRF